jgi:hypothetical protein
MSPRGATAACGSRANARWTSDIARTWSSDETVHLLELARRLRRHVARTGSAQMLVVRYGVQLMLTMLRRLLLGDPDDLPARSRARAWRRLCR